MEVYIRSNKDSGKKFGMGVQPVLKKTSSKLTNHKITLTALFNIGWSPTLVFEANLYPPEPLPGITIAGQGGH